MDAKVFSEQYLIEYCAPTLASLKMANLFRFVCVPDQKLEEVLNGWNEKFSKKGLGFAYFRRTENAALIYVYRRSELEKTLEKRSVRHFLQRYGYERFSVECALETLAERLEQSVEFPHEIGIFLGYPLGDVIGFIENGGKNCKCIGSWKVYCNEHEARRNFQRFNKCKSVYSRLWKEGSRSIMQLTVAG